MRLTSQLHTVITERDGGGGLIMNIVVKNLKKALWKTVSAYATEENMYI